MSEPTKGPWRVIHPILEGGSLNVVQNRHTVTKQKVIARVEDCSRRADTEANARLVASAPELLEAAERAVEAEDAYAQAEQENYVAPTEPVSVPREIEQECIDAHKALRAAIWKARGEQ